MKSHLKKFNVEILFQDFCEKINIQLEIEEKTSDTFIYRIMEFSALGAEYKID